MSIRNNRKSWLRIQLPIARCQLPIVTITNGAILFHPLWSFLF